MSETSQPTVNPPVESTPSEKPVTEQKPNESVSLLNEEPTEKPTTETKTEEPLKDGEKKDPPPGAPEKYDAFTLPEGLELSDEVVAEVSTIFKELNLNQTQAQRLVDFHSKTLQATVEAAAKAPLDAWMDQKKAWKDEIKADPEIGGKLVETRRAFGAALDSLGNPALVAEFRKAMDLTGAGDNPSFIKVFVKMAERMTEGKPVDQGKPAGGAKPTPAQAMYPNLPSAG